MSRAPELNINVTKFTQDEVIAAVESECPDFKYIPEKEKWSMALFSIGQTPAVIAAVTGLSEDVVKVSIDRYRNLTSQLPDGAKSKINQRMIWNAMGSYISVITDTKKIDKLEPMDAAKIFKLMPDMLRELMKIEEQYYRHQEEMNKLNFSGFANALEATASKEKESNDKTEES